MSREENKLKFYGLIRSADLEGKTLDYSVVSDYLEVPVATLKRWAEELKKMDETDSITKLVNVDQVMIDKIAKEVQQEVEAADSPVFFNPVTGAIETRKPVAEVTAKQQVSAEKIKQFKDGVTGLQLLNSETQAAAGTLISRISELAADDDSERQLSPRDIASLANSLASIQNAFFNKPTTQILVNQTNGGDGQGTSLLDMFKARLKP